MKTQFLVVNKQGFGSVYALMMLQIVLVFVLLVFTCTKSMLVARNTDSKYHRETLFAIYVIKDYLHQELEEEEEEEEDSGWGEEAKGDDETTWEEEEEEFPDIEERNYLFENNAIHIFYEEQQARVTLSNGVVFHVSFDRIKQSILDLVYSS